MTLTAAKKSLERKLRKGEIIEAQMESVTGSYGSYCIFPTNPISEMGTYFIRVEEELQGDVYCTELPHLDSLSDRLEKARLILRAGPTSKDIDKELEEVREILSDTEIDIRQYNGPKERLSTERRKQVRSIRREIDRLNEFVYKRDESVIETATAFDLKSIKFDIRQLEGRLLRIKNSSDPFSEAGKIQIDADRIKAFTELYDGKGRESLLSRLRKLARSSEIVIKEKSSLKKPEYQDINNYTNAVIGKNFGNGTANLIFGDKDRVYLEGYDVLINDNKIGFFTVITYKNGFIYRLGEKNKKATAPFLDYLGWNNDMDIEAITPKLLSEASDYLLNHGKRRVYLLVPLRNLDQASNKEKKMADYAEKAGFQNTGLGSFGIRTEREKFLSDFSGAFFYRKSA